MTKVTHIGMLSVAATLASGAAFAEGLERSTFSSGFMYEDGNFVELSMGRVTPDIKVTAGGVTSSDSVAQAFTATNLSFKTQASENFSLGFKVSNSTNGVNIDY